MTRVKLIHYYTAINIKLSIHFVQCEIVEVIELEEEEKEEVLVLVTATIEGILYHHLLGRRKNKIKKHIKMMT